MLRTHGRSDGRSDNVKTQFAGGIIKELEC